MPEDAAQFMHFVNHDQQPIARALLEQYSIFVDQVTQRHNGQHSQMSRGSEQPLEVWAQGESVTHQQADDVATTFLCYLRHDLSLRKWGGTFDYNVEGVVQQGYVNVSIGVDTGNTNARLVLRVHYLARPASS